MLEPVAVAVPGIDTWYWYQYLDTEQKLSIPGKPQRSGGKITQKTKKNKKWRKVPALGGINHTTSHQLEHATPELLQILLSMSSVLVCDLVEYLLLVLPVEGQ